MFLNIFIHIDVSFRRLWGPFFPVVFLSGIFAKQKFDACY